MTGQLICIFGMLLVFGAIFIAVGFELASTIGAPKPPRPIRPPAKYRSPIARLQSEADRKWRIRHALDKTDRDVMDF